MPPNEARSPVAQQYAAVAWIGLCRLSFLALGYWLTACASAVPERSTALAPYLVVLGIAQDGGVPQTGSRDHPAWRDASLRRLVVSLGLVDPDTDRRWLFEATPDIREQLHRLQRIAPVAADAPILDGIFLTHAHIGHYTGLAQLGHEVLGARNIPVWVMPDMARFLSANGPWDQLVRYGNIGLQALSDGVPVHLAPGLSVTPLQVPHRQEYSEVVGFRIEGPSKAVLFIPDIDSWDALDAMGASIENWISTVDVAYLDATFYADGEIPGRDMSGFPHPFIADSMARFESLPDSERQKIRFIHLNHTNPALNRSSAARRQIEALGFAVARELETVGL